MDERHVIGNIDPLSVEHLAELGSVAGPCVSVFMPTHRRGAETQQDGVRLRNITDTAQRTLRERGATTSVVDELIAPLRRTVDDNEFWQHQADGLAIFSAPGCFERFRLPVSFDEELCVTGSFRVRPLLSSLTGDDTFHILALSQNHVRLFEASRYTVAPVDLGSTPTSMAEALAYDDPERQLQFRSLGGRDVAFHGHGAGAEADDSELERYIRAVGSSLAHILGDMGQPLVLASVESYLPVFRAVSGHPNVLDDVVAGNPERRSPAELHRESWPIVEARRRSSIEQTLARFQDALGTGKAVNSLPEVVAAAHTGRVEVLIIPETAPAWGRISSEDGQISIDDTPSLDNEDLIDRALFDTVAKGGRICATGTAGPSDRSVGAILRY